MQRRENDLVAIYVQYANIMDVTETSTRNTPLAPSVEKAYYRKCIELKRRLNEVEAANDETKIKRNRLDRGIMKMRLERAFLLDELRKRMEYNVDGSEASGDEEVVTPPADRPSRDKRRRPAPTHPSTQGPSASSHAHQAMPYVPSQPDPAAVPIMLGPGGSYVSASGRDENARYRYVPPQGLVPLQQHIQPPSNFSYQPPQQSGRARAPVGLPSGPDRRVNGMSLDGTADPEAIISREAGAVGEALSAGHTTMQDVNGERRVVSSSSAEDANAEIEKQEDSRGGFTAVNQ